MLAVFAEFERDHQAQPHAAPRTRQNVQRDRAAAVDPMQSAVLAGMRTVLEGRAGGEHAVAALVLRALGIEPDEADAIATKPLPR